MVQGVCNVTAHHMASRSGFEARTVCRTAERAVRSLNLDREMAGPINCCPKTDTIHTIYHPIKQAPDN